MSLQPTKMRRLNCSTMGILHHHHRFSATAFALLFLASSAFSSSSSFSSPTNRRQLGKGLIIKQQEMKEEESSVMNRRRLGGLGSSPPTCRYKCGRCTPCKPTHVPIQPGLSLPLEYYPEAWRCKCGNKLFMP